MCLMLFHNSSFKIGFFQEGKLKPMSGPRGFNTPSHVLFADDIMIFCRGTKQNLKNIMVLFKVYGEASGQNISPEKCKFYCGSLSHRRLAEIASVLGFNAGSLPFTYLGVPIFKGKPKTSHLQPIADKIRNKLATWKGSLLSIVGRVELVKKVVTVSWKKVRSPYLEGGLDIRPLRSINQAATLKLSWDFLTSNSQWAGFLRARLLKNNSPRSSFVKSSIWPSIRNCFHTVMENSSWQLDFNSKISSIRSSSMVCIRFWKFIF